MAQITLDLTIPNGVFDSLQAYIADNPRYATVKDCLHDAVKRFIGDLLDLYPTPGWQQHLDEIARHRQAIQTIRDNVS